MGSLDLLIKDINKQYKTEIITKGTHRIQVAKIPFTSVRANYMTYGGIPRGKATEFFGTEGGGKTTSALDICANAQKVAMEEYEEEMKVLVEQLEKYNSSNAKDAPKEAAKVQAQIDELEQRGIKKVVYIDAENTLDEEWATLLGVNVDELILVKPQEQTAEQVLQMILDICKCNDVIMVVLDSIPMLVSQQIFEESLEKKSYAGISAPLTTFSSKISSIISKNMIALLMINQCRDDIDNPYNMYSSPGGRAVKHLYALRLFFTKGSPLDDDNVQQKSSYENPSGNIVDIRIIKTKVCKPNRKLGFYTLNYTNGIDYVSDLIDIAVKYGVIRQAGSWFQIIDDETDDIMENEAGEPLKFQGKPKLLNYFRDNDYMYKEIEKTLFGKMGI